VSSAESTNAYQAVTFGTADDHLAAAMLLDRLNALAASAPTCASCGQPYPADDQTPGSGQCYSCRHDELIEPPDDVETTREQRAVIAAEGT